MNKYKTYEELKEELGDEFEEYMYKANIELLTKIDKAREFIEEWCTINSTTGKCVCYLDKNRCTELYKILGVEE